MYSSFNTQIQNREKYYCILILQLFDIAYEKLTNVIVIIPRISAARKPIEYKYPAYEFTIF